VADPELLLKDPGHTGAGPDLPPKPIRLRAVPEELRDQSPLSGGEPGRGTGAGLGAQGLRPAVPGTGEPAAAAVGGGAERLGDVVPRPAVLLQTQRLKPPPLQPIRRKEIRDLHTLFYAARSVTFTAQRSVEDGRKGRSYIEKLAARLWER